MNAEKMAPAQDVVRVALSATRSGAERVADGAVEAALDIYDYAVLFAAKCQGLFAKLISGSAGPEGASATGMAVATTPVGAFAARVAGGAAYFVDAAVNGQWAKILCYKPFRTVAAVTLTLMRIVVSWFLSGVEFACSMLYATPAYVAVVVVLAVVVARGRESADARRRRRRRARPRTQELARRRRPSRRWSRTRRLPSRKSPKPSLRLPSRRRRRNRGERVGVGGTCPRRRCSRRAIGS